MTSILGGGSAGNDDDLLDWYPSQVKGPVDDEVQEGRQTFRVRVSIELFFYVADLISTIEFNHDGELLAVGDKGGRIVVFQREQQVGPVRRDETSPYTCSLILDESITTSNGLQCLYHISFARARI